MYTDPKCLVKGKKCSLYNHFKHYAKVCKTNKQSTNGGNIRVSEVNEKSSEEREPKDCAFGLRQHGYINAVCAKVVKCAVGGIELDFLLDSGAACNIVDEATWDFCKNRKIICNSSKKSKKRIFAYGQKEALDLLGEFDCFVSINKKRIRATFVVIKGYGKSLLGYKMATELEILKIGTDLEVNRIENQNNYIKLFNGIGKLKNF